jgi:hypothetical protein
MPGDHSGHDVALLRPKTEAVLETAAIKTREGAAANTGADSAHVLVLDDLWCMESSTFPRIDPLEGEELVSNLLLVPKRTPANWWQTQAHSRTKQRCSFG